MANTAKLWENQKKFRFFKVVTRVSQMIDFWLNVALKLEKKKMYKVITFHKSFASELKVVFRDFCQNIRGLKKSRGTRSQ